ncbi:hypothetical protein [Modicisalibacter radicis]|uniref:hypothetical protein n=1 Tax=Halomonas sp. EAR18 TaxID=2518972 RepID=UPI0014445276|nr:hypothetical protein [Halomonas sp. EAR18]
MGAKGVATGPALEIVEHLIIQLAAKTCPDDTARRATNQSTKDGSGDTTNGDPYRTAYCTNQRACLGATPSTGRSTRCAGYGASGSP